MKTEKTKKTIKRYAPFVKSTKLFNIPPQYFFSLRENDLIEIYDLKLKDNIELIVDFSEMVENVLPRNKNLMIMLDNGDPMIKNTKYTMIICAAEVHKHLQFIYDEKGKKHYGLDVRNLVPLSCVVTL